MRTCTERSLSEPRDGTLTRDVSLEKPISTYGYEAKERGVGELTRPVAEIPKMPLAQPCSNNKKT